KAIELYNGTGKTIDLSNYKLELYTNGSTSPNNTENLNGTLEHGQTYVLYNGSASSVLKSVGDRSKSSSIANFNGDDVIVLKKKDEVIDIFGLIGNPKNNHYAQDKTFVRKSNVTSGTAE